jgi:hypothetical protein
MFPQSFKQKDKNQLMAAAKTDMYHVPEVGKTKTY